MDKHKRDKYGYGRSGRIKTNYETKKIAAPGVEIDPPGGSAVVDIKKSRALIPC
jgi:hypothetical protein